MDFKYNIYVYFFLVLHIYVMMPIQINQSELKVIDDGPFNFKRGDTTNYVFNEC